MTAKNTIEFSEEQAQLLDIATNFCRDKSPMANVRKLLEDERGYDPSVWNEIVELGWLGVAVPEEFGGAGLSLKEVVALVEPMGRYLLSTPFVSTTLAAQALLNGGTEEQKSIWLPRLCQGQVATLALAEPHGDINLHIPECTARRVGDDLVLSGTKTVVSDAAEADLIVVSVSCESDPALLLIEKAQLPAGAHRPETSIDETRRTFTLLLDGITVPSSNLLAPDRSIECLDHIERCACLLLSAEMCGGTAAALDYVVEYLTTRKQFDRFIGSYQALKHPTVDILTGLEAARSHLYFAASVLDDGQEGEVAVRMAKAQAGDALSFAGDRAIQFHGGFGFTYDCDAHLYRRRAIWGQSQFGDSAYQRQKLASLLLD